MERRYPIDEDYANELATMNEAKTWVMGKNNNCCGTSVDVYQFSHDPNKYWNEGNIFHANNPEDISFGDMIEVQNGNNKRDAVFSVLESNNQKNVEYMMQKRLKHVGILNHQFSGYNSQISKFVSGFSAPTCTFGDWLEAQKQGPPSTTIPTEVQTLIRSCCLAIEAIWAVLSTADGLANASSYHMIDNMIKIDPLCIRPRIPEDKFIDLRKAFSNMILHHIYPVWKDDELEDFIDLLRNPNATTLSSILGAPVLISPAKRELMYHTFDKDGLPPRLWNWLKANADLGGDWKNRASNVDPTLKQLIDNQEFLLDVQGALHFARVVTAHYRQHFKGQWVKDRVDMQLRQVLPRLLSRRYNAQYA